jgi:tetratricopeptide (TPR) repeat protein
MNTHNRNKLITFAVLSIFAAVFFVLYGPLLASNFFVNIGALSLNRTLATNAPLTNDVGESRDSSDAIRLLELATQLDARNSTAWRTLGYLWLTFDEEDKALAAWQHTPEMSREMNDWAKRATERGDLKNAISWHRRNAAFLPEFGDSLYYEGLILARQKNWPAAISTFEQASKRGVFQTPLLSDIYFQLGSIYQREADYRDLHKARAMYALALELDEFSDETVEAETYYKRGEILEGAGDHEAAADEYQRTLDILPSHVWARLRYGYTRYLTDKNLGPAERDIQDVIKIWKSSKSANLKWAYRYMGEVYEDAGQIDAALAAYVEAAQLDPENVYLQNKLAALEQEK